VVSTPRNQTWNDENEVSMICMQAVEREHVNFLDATTSWVKLARTSRKQLRVRKRTSIHYTAVSLLAQCTKFCVTWRTNRKRYIGH